MLASFALSLSASAYMMLTFAAFSTICAEAYSISDAVVNSCVTVFLACSILFNLVASNTLESYGLARTFRICAAANILGAWIRYGALAWNGNFYLLLIGQTFPAIA